MLYNFEKLKKIVSLKVGSKRFNHILSVVDMSLKLAKHYNADVEKCKIASLLHDISKEMDYEYMKRVCRENFQEDLSEVDLENKEILHSFVGAYWVEKELKIKDREILSAIKNHTLGNKNMSLVEKIVYIADAIEMGRNYPKVKEIRDLTFKDLNKGILMEVVNKNNFLKDLGKKSHKNTLAMQEELEKLSV